MKKTLTALLLASLCGLAAGEAPKAEIVTFDNTDTSAWATEKLGISGGIPVADTDIVGTSGGEAFSKTLSDDTKLVINLTNGGGRIRANTGTTFVTTGWTNTAAFTDMSNVLGKNITLANVSGLNYVTAGQEGRQSSLVLSPASTWKDQKVVFYIVLSCGDSAQKTSALTNLTVSGLDNASVSYATATGDGFSSTLNTSETGYQKLTIAKVTGTVTESDITFSETVSKNGWAMAAWNLAPTLTETTVTSASVLVEGTGVSLTLNVKDNLDGVTGGFNAIVGEATWDSIVAGMGDTSLDSAATVTLVGADGTSLVLGTGTNVTLNGYAGEADGKYVVKSIPEPATATLSLLALAGLAARRRRK